MSVGYMLVNASKREVLMFSHLPVNSIREIVGNPATASMVAWYLYKNAGCEVQFVSDTLDDWPFLSESKSALAEFDDVTDQTLQALVEEGILVNDGVLYQDPDEEGVFVRRIRNVWTD